MIDGTDIDLSATANEFPALLCEFKTDIATYLQTYVDGTNLVSGQPYAQTLADLIAFDTANPDRGTLERCDLRGCRGDERPRRRVRCPPGDHDAAGSDTIDQLMAENHLDAIIALTNGPSMADER